MPPNDVRHMSSAITLASSWTEPGASAITMSNTLSTLISIVMKTTLSTGASSGTVIRRKTCHSVAPSVRAASSVSRGIAASPAAITTIAKPAQIQMYANMIDGVISFSPSHEMPSNGCAKVSSPIATTVVARLDLLERERAVLVRRGALDLVACAVQQLDRDPREAELLRLDTRPECRRRG